MSILCLVIHILCVYAVKLLSGFFWDTVWPFLVKTGWQPASAGKGANCALAVSVLGASRSRLCADGPRVHLSGPAYMPSCIRSEVSVHVVLGSHMRPCKPSALDLTIANTWVRLQQSSQGGSL